MARKWQTRFPKSVKIGPHTYDVEWVRELRGDNDTRLMGQISYSEQIIRMDKDLPSQPLAVETFVHECMHGYENHFGLNRKKLDNLEEIIEAMGKSVYMLMRDNPKLVKLIMER